MSYFENIFNPDRRKKKGPKTTLDITVEGAHQISGGPAAERRPEAKIIDQRLCAGFEIILTRLKENPHELASRIEKLQSLPDYDGILGKLEPYFNKEHWEILAVLEAYDQSTFEHSLRVAASVYDMASGGETESYLRSRIEIEESSLKELLAAALFHDIGKTAIPQEILHDNHSKREWAKRANEWATRQGADPHFDPKKIEELDDTELDHYFMQVHADDKDPLNIVPIRAFFSEKTLRELEQHGISPDSDTFRKVLECHEQATRAILRSKKMYIAADIASHHHDYDHTPIRLRRNPTETSAIRIGLELSVQNYAAMVANGLSVLRSMDIYDALTSSDRGYLKKPFHPLIALEVLIKDAEAEFTEPELTKYLVRDLYKKLEVSQKNVPSNDDESRALAKVLAFIEK
jgi:hypothetical protein